MSTGTMAGNWEQLQAEAVAIVRAAANQDVTLRVVGSAGIRLHCQQPGPLMDRLGRPAKDIDFIVPQQHRKGMRRLLEGRGYVVDRDLLVAMEGTRYSFAHAGSGIEIDVFVERLDFCHRIELTGRLTAHPVTIPIEELLLQKIQIVQMTTTDLIDASVLLATHKVGEDGAEGIDAAHIARLLARDWGFHHTATRNLGRIAEYLTSAELASLTEGGCARVRRGIEQLMGMIDAQDKTLGWRMREKIGERKQWWQDVDDREATY
ncbi:hypothetical protein [Trebonia sp.]|uniref:hypothetical protein n=1 Tax=Trebonia sp. TaxID=2767075 RepID=UPI00261E8BE5|nr:hypothetical protein [Trebonia sp.]